MFDMKKISFNEMDNSVLPIQFFFDFNLTQDELDKWLAFYADENDIDENKNVISIEICVNMFSKADWKIEGVFLYDDNTQVWSDLMNTTDACDFMEIIKNTDTERAKEAYAEYRRIENMDIGSSLNILIENAEKLKRKTKQTKFNVARNDENRRF